MPKSFVRVNTVWEGKFLKGWNVTLYINGYINEQDFHESYFTVEDARKKLKEKLQKIF